MTNKNNERLFPNYVLATAFVFLFLSAVTGGEVFTRFADPVERFPAILEGDQELSYRIKAGSKGLYIPAESQKELEITINSQGLRDREILYEKPWNTVRIMTLGSSSTFGWGLPAEESFPKVLEKTLSEQLEKTHTAFEVVNAGIPGYTISQSLKFYQQELHKYSPDVVVLFLEPDTRIGSINLHTLENEVVKEKGAPPLYKGSFFCSHLQEKSLFASRFCEKENRFFPQSDNVLETVTYTKRAEKLELMLIKELEKTCSENGTKLVIVFPKSVPMEQSELVKELTSSTILSLSEDEAFKVRGYLDQKESVLVAQLLRDFLLENYSQENPTVPATE